MVVLIVDESKVLVEISGTNEMESEKEKLPERNDKREKGDKE